MVDQQQNPYAPPKARVEDIPDDRASAVLATRWARLGGALIDVVVLVATVLPLMYLLGWVETEPSLAEAMRSALLGFLFFVAFNGLLLARHGQTIGKWLVGTRIVRTDGSKASLSRLLGLRYGVGYLIGAIPLVGAIYGFVDSVLIFRKSRKCLHDNIADTLVINK